MIHHQNSMLRFNGTAVSNYSQLNMTKRINITTQ
ncbi:hypothetical protein BAQU_0096 [Bifidobacterium aquikefiri]|uniref:Uncharacterized protein n=1 Tax=Bifidobacterium aquikefiri TaxID=1653207 RepID=A0A261GCB1_9BIFI|nr:hypothetical protein BAQU_0096 [Bifidobacterium aquikefiri]